MTTPERIRRRQRIESVLLIVIGLAMILQSLWFNSQSVAQRDCLEEKFSELSVALEARARIAERESSQNRALWGIFAEAAGLVREDPSEELTRAEEAALQEELVDQLLEYQRTVSELYRERKENPVPPYPIGECNQ